MALGDTPDPPARDRSWLRFVLAAAAILLAAGLTQVRWGERVPVARGAGWDGKEYARIAADLPGELRERRLDRYRLRRVLPSALAYGTLAVWDRPPTVGRIARVFAGWNVAFLLAACGAWAAIARTVGIGPRGRWLGFILLFGNFANLKMPYYYTILTDSAALCLGAFLVLFHLRDQAVPMWATLVLAAFTWPSLAVFGAGLFVVRRGPHEALVGGTGGGITAAVLALLYVAGVTIVREDVGSSGPVRLVVAVSIAALYVFVVTSSFLPPPSAWPRLLAARVLWPRVAVLAATAGVLEVAISAWSEPTAFTHAYFLYRLLVLSVWEPGLFLVAHPVYFGLVVPLLALGWSGAARAARGLGPGVMLFLWAHLVWALHPETRTVIDVLPLLVLLVTAAEEPRPWSRGALLALAALALAVSKVWLPLTARIV
jgi:hypothetical protein